MPSGNRRPLYSDDDVRHAPDPPSPIPEPPGLQPGPGSMPRTTDAPFKQPCTLKGVASGAYAGVLGYFLGIVPAAIKFKGKQWGLIHGQGMASAGQLALMSGMYTAVHCICQRIRLVEDGWNRGIAGCSTGIVLGWKGGPWSALQSCAGLGLISALVDLGGGAVEAAEAAALSQLQQLQEQRQQRQQRQQQQHPWSDLELLAMQLLATPTSSSGSSQHAARRRAVAAGGEELHQYREQQPHQQHQQQSLLLLPQARQAVQQHLRQLEQIVAASPLMFLGACCHGAATAAVDACPISGPAAVPAAASALPAESAVQQQKR